MDRDRGPDDGSVGGGLLGAEAPVHATIEVAPTMRSYALNAKGNLDGR